MKNKLSIITPTLNEEDYLPKLLKSISIQKYPCEVIVSDSDSGDSTRKIAKSKGCKVVHTKSKTPGAARNAAAKVAKGNLILFLDADIILPKDFLRRNIEYFEKKKLDLAGGHLKSLGGNLFDKFIIGVANIWISTTQYFHPDAFGACILVKKKLFDKHKGFDKSIVFGEDLDFVKRAAKGNRFGLLPMRAYVSMRRFDTDGRFALTIDYIKLHMTRFFKKIKNSDAYHFGDF